MQRRTFPAVRAIVFLLLSCIGRPAAQDPAPERFDVLVAGGEVIDGSGSAARRADVGITGGRIVAIGDLAGRAAVRTLDAGGLIVAPGFIDVHAHADNIASRPLAPNFTAMGVTTIVSGNCGYSNEAIAEHLAQVDKVGSAINYATLIGHGTLRHAAMGGDENRAPSGAELAKMQASLRTALTAGAVGMSTGLIYVPGTYAQTDELLALATVLAEFDAVYASHIRNENARVLEAIEEALQIARRAGARVHLSHLKVSGRSNWGIAPRIVELLRDARHAGLPVTGDQYAYDASSTSLDVLFPTEDLAIGRKTFATRLAEDADFSARMMTALDATIERAGFGDLSYCRIAHAPHNTQLDGMTLKEAAAKELGGDDAARQAEMAVRLFRDAQGDRVSMIYHTMAETDVETLMREAWIAVACDAGVMLRDDVGKPHPRGCGNNPRVLGHYVRTRGLLELPLAVHKMTALPAAIFGLEERGTVAVGNHADLTLFDPLTVTDNATYAEPHLPPTGIPFVLVNGELVVDAGRPTRARPGTVLRRSRGKQK